jgi:mRNA-degrading endonuclease RelE of RelBE toxin-antitoxin system
MTAKPPARQARAVPRFTKSKRRLSPVVQAEVDSQIKALMDNPLVGEVKKGALKGVRVVKFKADDRQYLLAYYFHAKPNIIEALDVAVHENFYRGLESYLRDRP